MLLRHSVLYALARGLPGMVNFVAIYFYTRLLVPDAYGEYVLILAAVGLFDSVLFRWLSIGLLRFLPAHGRNPQVLLSAVFSGFLAMVALTAAIGIVLLVALPQSVDRGLIAIAVVLLWASAWFQTNLELIRSKLTPLRYGAMTAFKSVLALVTGIVLLLYGFGAYGPLAGLLAGTLISTMIFTWREWTGMRLKSLDRQLVYKLLMYGLPLTATFALTFVISSSDRFILAYFMGSEAAGLYAPGYDIAQHSIGILMTVVNLAAYPLAVQALEKRGEEAARAQLKNNGLLLLAVSVPAAAGFTLCAHNIAHVALGEVYRETAVMLIPWIAATALLSGFKSFFLDLSFQLSGRTMGQLWTALAAAVVNFGLNLWWIPEFGLLGAAYATVVAYALAFILSLLLGRRAFRLPALPVESYKVIVATLIMAVTLWFTLEYRGLMVLLGQVLLGGSVYTAALLACNLGGSRQKVSRYMVRTLASGKSV